MENKYELLYKQALDLYNQIQIKRPNDTKVATMPIVTKIYEDQRRYYQAINNLTRR